MPVYDLSNLIKKKNESLDSLSRIITLLEKTRKPVYISLNKKDPASVAYTIAKKNMFEKYGFPVHLVDSLKDASVCLFDASAMVQLPHEEAKSEIDQIYFVANDIDCMTETSLGKMMSCKYPLACNGQMPPATVKAIMDIIADFYGEDSIAGKRVVVVGKSNIVGKPLSLILMNHGASVTIFGSDEFEPLNLIKDISPNVLVLATPKMHLFSNKSFSASDVELIIDVGYGVDSEGNPAGNLFVDKEGAGMVYPFYTPVPGGVGPLTVRNLVENHMLYCIRGY